MAARKRTETKNAKKRPNEDSAGTLQIQSYGESVVDPEFDSKIDDITDAIRLKLELTSHEEEDKLAQTMFENDEREFRALDLVGQLEWFDRKLGVHSDAVLVSNDRAKGAVRQKYLKKLLNARRKLQKEIDVIIRAVERRKAVEQYDPARKLEGDEPDVPKKFTRKQIMYLLQELIPDFKHAVNMRKAEFIVMLTPYHGKKNISDEYSNIRNFADPTLLEDWKERFKSSGRGRKKSSS